MMMPTGRQVETQLIHPGAALPTPPAPSPRQLLVKPSWGNWAWVLAGEAQPCRVPAVSPSRAHPTGGDARMPGDSAWRAIPSPGSGSPLCPPQFPSWPQHQQCPGPWDPKAARERGTSQQQAGGPHPCVPPQSPELGPTGLSHPTPSWVPLWVQHKPPPISILSLCQGNRSQEQETTGPGTVSPRPHLPGDVECPPPAQKRLRVADKPGQPYLLRTVVEG